MQVWIHVYMTFSFNAAATGSDDDNDDNNNNNDIIHL
jgi:hypothetical protein